MEDDNLWPLLTTFAFVSLLAVGGANAVAPEIQRIVVQREGWMDSATFARLFGIAQAAPGPNLLLVSLVGWKVAGWTGLLVSTFAVLIPSSMIALFVGRVRIRLESTSWFQMLQRALIPIALGLIMASGIAMARSADTNLLYFAITVFAAIFAACSRYNPLWTIAGGAAASLAVAAATSI